MAQAVADAITQGHHLVAEAGTGVGKSFAYLVPAILAVANETESGIETPRRRVVISTHTISLQEQLISRDLPLLNSVIPLEFSAVLVKGRQNYVSLRRLQLATERAKSQPWLKERLPLIPVRRAAEPEDIAEVVLFLGSKRNRFVVGETVLANGGYTML